MIRYRKFKIEPSATEKFPDMVSIHKGKKFSKRFINEVKAKAWINSYYGELLIERGETQVKSALEEIVILEE